MKVYRVEHKTCGIGPYSGDVRVKYTTYKHLVPWRDGLEDCRGYHFGFISEDTLAGWFIDSLMMLHNAEYICRVYNIKKKLVRVGRTYSQCVFARDSADSNTVISLKDIFEKYKREIYST